MTLHKRNLPEVQQDPILTSHVSSAEIARPTQKRTTTQAKAGLVPPLSFWILSKSNSWNGSV